MITRHMQMLEELRAIGWAVVAICPQDLGPVSREQAEEWMYDCINECIQIKTEEQDND